MEKFNIYDRSDTADDKIIQNKTERGDNIKKEIPIWEKSNLTLEEAAVYFNIGINKLRDLTNDENCKFVIWCGSKRLIKRKALEKYLESTYSI